MPVTVSRKAVTDGLPNCLSNSKEKKHAFPALRAGEVHGLQNKEEELGFSLPWLSQS